MTYLYTELAGKGDKSRTGAMATVLGADMLTIRSLVFVAPAVNMVPVPDLRDMSFLRHLPSVK